MIAGDPGQNIEARSRIRSRASRLLGLLQVKREVVVSLGGPRKVPLRGYVRIRALRPAESTDEWITIVERGMPANSMPRRGSV
jgi:hypothetical protein